MNFKRKAKRAGKHIGRFISKPFTGANKTNLRALDPIVQKMAKGQMPSTLQVSTLRYGQFDFTWLTMLGDDEIVELCGEWAACFQSSQRSTSGTRYAFRVDPMVRSKMLNGNDKAFWNALQDVKKRYKAIAEERVSGFFKKIKTWFSIKKSKVDDWSTQNKYFGPYLTMYQTVNGVFDEATMRGAKSDMDRKILAAGGLWRVVKTGASFGKKLGKMLLTPNPKTLVGLVKGGVQMLNQIGGLLAGLTDMVRKQEADFRRLSARFGLDQNVDALKKKYLGEGVIEEGDTLKLQMEQGPQRLERAAKITYVELEELREKFKRAQWWCAVWRKDIEEIEKDIEEKDVILHLKQIFAQLTSEDSLVKPSQISELQGFIQPNRDEMRKQARALAKKVQRFDDMLGGHLIKMDDLLSAYETRRSLAFQQKRSAGIGLTYDIKRQLGDEIKGFDLSLLRSHKLPRKGQREPEEDPQDLGTVLRTALATRRQYIAPDEDEETDEDVLEWMD